MGVAPFRALIGWVLVALMLVSSGCDRLGRQASPAQESNQPLAPTVPRGALQEVAPPPLVQDLRTRLDRRDPQVSILAPADGALLPAGPWTLELQAQDWPLADAGPLGLGPHLVVQLDNAPPLRISDASAASHLAMPPLTPGSHRLTVYAARPWGEVVKSPGASRQIRLDRVAANPQQVPVPGSPQLLAALASPGPSQEPVLIDWLLLDAPLQHLRDDDGRWRLRVSVNGDSFLVDRQTPLWLKGFHGGSNAVQLELLDGRGEPLNPPFNSLVEEVVIQPGPGAAWQRPSLTALEQAQLLGEAPLAPEARPDASQAPAPQAAEHREHGRRVHRHHEVEPVGRRARRCRGCEWLARHRTRHRLDGSVRDGRRRLKLVRSRVGQHRPHVLHALELRGAVHVALGPRAARQAREEHLLPARGRGGRVDAVPLKRLKPKGSYILKM
jgi:hypothetical protein